MPPTPFPIRKAVDADFPAIADLAWSAFGSTEGPEIVQLIAALSADPTAQPLLSLVAVLDDRVVGHVLFSKATLAPSSRDVTAALLAPLAVLPDVQSQGIGSRLVTEGLRLLSDAGTELVFVLGHPGYYPRFGFREAGIRGFAAPHPIPDKNAAAWMVCELRPGAIGQEQGQVACADAIADLKYWTE